ncbi:MAG: hypothetical protein AB8H80_06740 [Planctomycetota bacterium]
MKKKLLIALLLTIVVTAVNWQLSALLRASWTLVIAAALPLAGIAVLVLARIKQRSAKPATSFATVGVVLLSSGLAGAALAMVFTRLVSNSNMARGDQVAVALDKHWAAKSCYPETLAELVPEFATEVPQYCLGPFVRAPFVYMPAQKEGDYALIFGVTRDIVALRVDGEWSAGSLP